MLKFWKNTKEKQNDKTGSPALARMRRKILWQAGLAMLTIALTCVIVVGMTAAWQNNVVQSGGLTFQVAKYGVVKVDAQILSTDVIVMAPGDEGVVNIEVTNRSTQQAIVSVGVTKDQMDAEMQRRLYFYVDALQTQNGENVGRVYLNSLSTYGYTVFDELTLTEEYHNDAQLKWCWVYDVLGYYVLGRAENGSVTIEEYLRPIEYDYDEATFITAEDGTKILETVDGTTDPVDFLIALSENDGYAGTISSSAMTGAYYQVDVDENGYGVYAYLCTPAEVAAETEYDVSLAERANADEVLSYVATLNIYADSINAETVTIEQLAELSSLDLSTPKIVELSGDLDLGTQTLTLPEGADITLDLNGHKITTSSTDTAAIVAEEGSSLTITNGTLEGANGSYDAFNVTGAEVTLSGVTLTGYRYCMNIKDSAAEGQDSLVRMVNCNISDTSIAVLVYGNGTASQQTSKVIIENCQITTTGIAIGGNGSVGDGSAENPGNWGTDIQIINSTVTSASDTAAAGIYHPQKDSVLNIYNSTVSGYTGIAIKGGTVTITGSAIEGTGNVSDDPAYNNNGFSDTADAVYIETGYQYPISLTIDEISVLTSVAGEELRVFEEGAVWVTVVDGRGSGDGTEDAE